MSSKLLSRTTPSIKDFDIIKPISKGAYGTVFLAKKKATGDYYAIKVLKKADMIAKNQIPNAKAERMQQAESPFVAKLYFTFQSKDNLYLVMEYLNGGDCAALIKSLGCLPEEWTRSYIAEVILGLEYLHQSGIFHRDLKPDNLLIDSHGHLKLTDFGLSRIGRQTRDGVLSISPLARRNSRKQPPSINNPGTSPYSPSSLGDDHPNSSGMESSLHRRRSGKLSESPLQSFATELTTDLRSSGYLDYLAPETILDLRCDDATVDWWALGVITYEFLYGIPPFHADTPEKVFENILSGHVDWHEDWIDFQKETIDFMKRLLTLDPDERLGSGGAEEVKAHAFCTGIDWDKVTASEAAFIPQVTDPESTDYFDPRGAILLPTQPDLEAVDEAFFASKDRSTGTNPCLPCTRVTTLQAIRDWVNSESSLPLFWLHGPAGSGKSTIAHSIAKEWNNSGGSFFFSKAQLSLRESRLLFQTIAFQLRINNPILDAPISRALEDPAILTASNETQLQKLILDPILHTRTHLPDRLVIVIDALDECDDDIIVNIVEVLATTLEKCNPSIRIQLRILVTSRPEKSLVQFFTDLHIPSYDLSSVNHDDAEMDIRIFLEDELRKLAKSTAYELKEKDIQVLAEISGGVFVAARIAVDFVAFEKTPDSQLQKMHHAGDISGLDVVYRLVLETIAQDSSMRDILQPIATVVFSFTPLSKQALIDLLHIGTENLNNLLYALRAIIHVREGDAIYPIHASLRDFLTDPDRCTDPRIFVHLTHHHTNISRACFDRMGFLLQKPDVRSFWEKSLPGDLTYACQYWARHLAESNIDQPLIIRLHSFASFRLLYWVECLSHIGDLDLGISGLNIVNEVLVRSDKIPDDVTELLSDAHWFMEHFEDMLSISAMYTYTAALQLTPATTKLYQQYAPKFEGMALHLALKWDTQ